MYCLAFQTDLRQYHATAKVGVVYYTSLKTHEPSPNDFHSWFLNLFRVLLGFQTYRVGTVAAIEKTVLNNGILSEDRDALKLLWVGDLYEVD